MHDTLRFMSKEPMHRRYHHHDLTFGLLYAFTENFILPLSHDEVVHGKGSLLGKMPGDRWQRFANLRAYFGFMWGHPGKKLLFMGGEIRPGARVEPRHEPRLAPPRRPAPSRRAESRPRPQPALPRHARAARSAIREAAGFQWLVSDDAENSVIAWARRGFAEDDIAIVVSNFTPVPRRGYRLGVPKPGFYREVLNSDAAVYGGGDIGNSGGVTAEASESHGQPFSVSLTLPPLSTLILVLEKGG